MQYFIIISIIILIDQLSKIWIKINLSYHESIEIIGNFVRFTYVENPGIAFGISVGKFSLVILFLSIAIIAFIIREIVINKDNFSSIALSVILGGAIGNLIDRAYLGYVRDFIDLKFWPIFNILEPPSPQQNKHNSN